MIFGRAQSFLGCSMPQGMAQKPVSGVSTIIYIAWPPVIENGFVKAMAYGGKLGWLEQNAVTPLRRADGTTGGCTLRRRADGRIMFDLDPGVGINH
jgi:hypothetical protein